MITAAETKLPRILMPLPGPKAQAVIERDAVSISPSFTREYPLVVQRGQGAIIEDVDGNMFLDFAAGIATCSTGHCHPDVVGAIQKQAAELIHVSETCSYYESLPDVAERLAAIVPGAEAKKVFFTNSGTEAVEGAMKLARYATKRGKFIAFYGSFHGRTMGALSLTASKSVQRKGFGSLLAGVAHLPYPYAYRCSYGHTSETCGDEILEILERQIFKHLFDPQDVAGIIIEPILGEGGYVPAPRTFLQSLQRICRRHGITLIVDEVQSGMGRTGKWWASEEAGIEPDILCTAKGIASGMPLGAFVARSGLMTWESGSHSTTFGGNPVCLAAASATMDLIGTKYMENARCIGEYLLQQMADWGERIAIVGDVRGRGLMIGLEIVGDQRTKEPVPQLRSSIIKQAFHKGLLLLPAGDSSIRLSPSLMIDEAQASFALQTLEACLRNAR